MTVSLCSNVLLLLFTLTIDIYFLFCLQELKTNISIEYTSGLIPVKKKSGMG